ncbi:hypothetical protein M4D55_24990 [Metabacillus idriensis]|uniref:hypothetical protein n=1 Tax=Metabacillus idriensis TaxID=324768 RepID=UPI00174CC144|nr:hypothetical protein [Metabacillus idriensis]MCM3598997.1 hypothetical protein [Metabacillus idriensis]
MAEKIRIVVDEKDHVQLYIEGHRVRGLQGIAFSKIMEGPDATFSQLDVSIAPMAAAIEDKKTNVGELTIKVNVDASELYTALNTCCTCKPYETIYADGQPVRTIYRCTCFNEHKG